MMDHLGRIAFWNEAGQRIFGYSREEVQGKKLHELIIPARHRTEFERNFIDFRKTGKGPVIGKTLELAGLRRDGGDRHRGFRFRREPRQKMARNLYLQRHHRAQQRRENAGTWECGGGLLATGAEGTSDALRA